MFLAAASAGVCKLLILAPAGPPVLSVVPGARIHFHGSAPDLLLMPIPAAVGAGLVLKGAFTKKEKES